MSVQAVRISKTSAQKWTLHGPIDQALKTSIQADAVKFYPIHVELHGTPLDLLLWINAAEITEETTQGPNPNAMMVIHAQKLRDSGEDVEIVADDADFTALIVNTVKTLFAELTPVAGPAILTAAGGEDVPDVGTRCLLAALMLGKHE